METFLIIIHFLVTVLLMVVILLQSSKGGGLAGVFGGGGGGMGAVFGGRGAASFLSKLTTVLATLFLGLALLISYIDKGNAVDRSIVAEERERLERERASSPAAIVPTVPTDDAMVPGETLPMTQQTPVDTSN